MQAAQALALAAAPIEARAFAAEMLPEPLPPEVLPTPALLLDAAALDRNIKRMAEFLGGRGKGFRPHAKTHKCPLIAERQLAAGAVGVCAAKVSEAIALVTAGIDRVLITSPVATDLKALAVAGLAARADVAIVVDSLAGLELLRRAVPPGVELGVLVDVDVAMGRTGTRSDELLLELVDAAQGAAGVQFRGIQHYAGHVMHIEGHDKRRDASLKLWDAVGAKLDLLRARGHACNVVTGSGTGTYDIDCDVEFITDLQVGSYIFMDQEYRLIGGRSGGLFDDFEVSLTVATTAISQPTGRAVTVDGGYKAFASDTVAPEPLDLPGSRFRFAGDEHGALILPDGYQEPLVGSLQRFVTPHCDPTVNLHDAYWVIRDGMVTERWPISARGCSW